MRRLLVLALVLLPASLSAQTFPGSPFFGSGGSASVLSVFGNRMVVCPVKTLSNTSATTQDIASVTTTSGLGGSAIWFFTIVMSNGTLSNVESGVGSAVWSNNAGTVAGAVTTPVLQGGSDGSGTASNTVSVAVATNVITLRTAPAWVTIVPTSVTYYATFIVLSGDTLVCL